MDTRLRTRVEKILFDHASGLTPASKVYDKLAKIGVKTNLSRDKKGTIIMVVHNGISYRIEIDIPSDYREDLHNY